jgi:uncharacterized damage-inducible protein DinB
MSTLQPEQATFLRDAVLMLYRGEQALTTSVIKAIPAEQCDYRPNQVSRSAIDLAWHIVAMEHRFLAGVSAGAFRYDGASRPASIQTPRDVASWYEETFKADVGQLGAAPAEALLKVLGYKNMLRFPAVAYLQLALHHSIHHRGQLSMYLRPMGAKVPSIYGPSFDTSEG